MGVVLHRLDKQRQSEQLAEMLRCGNESHHHFCPNFCPHALLSSSSLSSSSSSSSPAFWSSRVTMLTVEASNLESVELSHYNHRQFWQFSELIIFSSGLTMSPICSINLEWPPSLQRRLIIGLIPKKTSLSSTKFHEFVVSSTKNGVLLPWWVVAGTSLK